MILTFFAANIVGAVITLGRFAGVLDGFTWPLVASTIVTLAHLGLCIDFFRRAVKGQGVEYWVAAIFALLGTLSWGSWVSADLVQYRSQSFEPIINIAGVPAAPLTVVLMVFCIVFLVKRRCAAQ